MTLLRVSSGDCGVILPPGEIIQCREASGRIAKWAVEIMSETISFASRKAIKSQVLVDFVAEWVNTQLPTALIQPDVTPGFKEQSQVHLIHAPRRQHI
jgi:hypothetical protein